MTSQDVQRFSNGTAQLATAAFGFVIVMLGCSVLVVSGTPVIGAVYLLAGFGFVVRGLRSSLVEVDRSAVTTRSLVRTRRYLFSELSSVEVEVGTTGFNGFGREHLVFHRADGEEITFKELNCRPSRQPDVSTVVQAAASCINDRLRGEPMDDGSR